MAVLDAFRLKEFDLEPVYASWDAPKFLGKPKKDMPVDEWLAQIKAGCLEHKVPKEYWHKVGQHYLGDGARARLDELKAVLRNMHGGKYTWNWKKFKVAMRNMGWDIDTRKTETYEVQSKPSGLWWIIGKNKPEETPANTKDSTVAAEKKDKEKEREGRTGRNPEKKSSLMSMISDKGEKGGDEKSAGSRPRNWLSRAPSTMSKRSSTDSVSSELSSAMCTKMSRDVTPSPPSSVAPTPAQSPGEVTTTSAHAPVWLLNACNALDFLTTEHPKTMTALSAVLITVGSLPVIPGIATGAGGAILASHAVQAAGAIAVGVGNWLKSAQEASAARATAEGQQATIQEAEKSSSR
ncbi:hypothetical protein EWM64_g549 [Hericium alpestre]|uniref:Uncharacterized protein n=1 Tax=Hericium alpestre TaxID=135208 RepID=A0A4Z0ACM5_9AGAM|nr:hypothetical protein EWM64_g549 [Hericium alpestre]